MSPTWLTTSSGNRQNGWWSEEMLIFHSSLKVIWGNQSFCVGEYVMQEQSKNIPSCFHSNSHASISLNSLIHSFSPPCELCPVCRGVKWCLQMCACSLFWQQGTSSSLLAATLSQGRVMALSLCAEPKNSNYHLQTALSFTLWLTLQLASKHQKSGPGSPNLMLQCSRSSLTHVISISSVT